MGYTVIEISESKLDKLSEYMETGLSAFGKAMTCIDDLQKKGKKRGRMSERYGGMNGGSNYGNRGGNYNQRDDDDWDDDDEMDDMDERYMGSDSISERRGVRGTGPYSRFRYRRY